MKTVKRVALLLVVAAIIATAISYLRFGGVTHEDLFRAVTGGTAYVNAIVDARYRALDKKLEAIDAKLDGVDAKLDRILKIAEGALPDGMTKSSD